MQRNCCAGSWGKEHVTNASTRPSRHTTPHCPPTPNITPITTLTQPTHLHLLLLPQQLHLFLVELCQLLLHVQRLTAQHTLSLVVVVVVTGC